MRNANLDGRGRAGLGVDGGETDEPPDGAVHCLAGALRIGLHDMFAGAISGVGHADPAGLVAATAKVECNRCSGTRNKATEQNALQRRIGTQ